MASYLVTLADTSTAEIDGADAYQQEGPLTTFFALANDRGVVDSWSVRLASFRTADVVAIRMGSETSCRSRGRRTATWRGNELLLGA